MNLDEMYREIEALGGAVIMDDYEEGSRDGLEAALAVLRKYGFGVDMAPGEGSDMIEERRWIDWTGGQCPVSPDSEVEVRIADGRQGRVTARLYKWDWPSGHDFAITQYRIQETT